MSEYIYQNKGLQLLIYALISTETYLNVLKLDKRRVITPHMNLWL